MTTMVNQFSSAAVSDRGLNEGRPHNEDSYIELAEHGFFAVADGVGGAQAGEVASQMAVEILGEAFSNMSEFTDPEDMMRVALERANEAIFQMSRDLPQLSSMATTVAAVHVSGDIATIAHVGDSRVYRCDPTGRLFRETDDHSVVEEEVRAGRMTPDQAKNHPSRNVISRALGAEETVEPDVKMVLVHPATSFLLCSDGITRHVEDEEIEDLLNNNDDPAEVCSILKEMCFQRGAEDNLTAVVVRFPGERRAPAAIMEGQDEAEEVTLAGVRPNFENEGGSASLLDVPEQDHFSSDQGILELDQTVDRAAEPVEDGSTGSAEEVEVPLDDEAYLFVEDVGAPDPEGISHPSSEEAVAASSTRDEIEEMPRTSYHADPAAGSGSFAGSVFAAMGFLIGGLLLGFIGGYYLNQYISPPTEPPAIVEQKSGNVQLTSFEETRRLVDADAAAYLNANAATPQEAADFLWLGRALLLTGKPVEAKRSLVEARRRLAVTDDPSNIKTMEHEIAMYLAIAENEEAVRELERHLKVSVPDPGNASTVSGSGSPTR
ncbi:MAG TPA: protein phosphatase 2C domain-containing protein [Pyrinomonadaceae bacterium]|nr:protein phosphatase 2C domain-containing protein [Pyrinomonadaceae bacterium]